MEEINELTPGNLYMFNKNMILDRNSLSPKEFGERHKRSYKVKIRNKRK